MSPILGIIASSKLVAAAGDFESIATATVGSTSVSTISFSSIPGTYNRLQIRALSKNNRSTENSQTLYMRFNGDSGSNYSYNRFITNGTTISGLSATSGPASYFYFGSAAESPASTFGFAIFDILDYANTNKYKTTRCLAGVENNTSGGIALASGLWQNTNAITSIDILLDGSNNHTQYSQFALYGIKGA